MAVNVLTQNFSGYQNEDIPFALLGQDNTNPTTWTLAVYVTNTGEINSSTTPLITVPSSSITVTGSGPYYINWSITSAQTGLLPVGIYSCRLRRTDVGFDWVLAAFSLSIFPPLQ